MRTRGEAAELEILPGVMLSNLFCVWLEAERTLVTADLHLGMEGVAAADGAYFPKRQKPVIERRLGAMLRRFRPELLVVAGDFKHNFGRNLAQEWNEVESVHHYLGSRTEVALVRGNHDNYLRSILPDTPLPEHLRAGGAVVAHGHRLLPELGGRKGLKIIAHEHPSLKLRDTVGAQVAVPAFLFDGGSRTLVLPALSPLAAGSDVLRCEPLSPVLRALEPGRMRVIAIGTQGLLDFGTLRDVADSQRQA